MRPQHRASRHLSDLVGVLGLGGDPSQPDVQLRGVAVGSADVLPGDLFVALPGLRTHGARYAGPAVRAGAVAVLTDAEGARLTAADPQAAGVPVVVTDRPLRPLTGEVSAWFYGHPDRELTVVGVTGTNGKTTTCYLVDAALATRHATRAVVGTVELRVGERSIESPRTTVESPVLHGLFALMRQEGATACVMEVSSHALALDRVAGVEFDVVGFTNLQRDHLDFHGDMEGYFADKARLFDPPRARRGVVCVDDAWGVRLAEEARIPVDTVATRPDAVGAATADWRVLEATIGLDRVGSSFTLQGPDEVRVEAYSPLPGLVNVSNAAVAIVLAHRAGVPLDQAVQAVARAHGVPGRMERVVEREPGGPLGLVDYAHTPDALTLALEAVRPITPGRLLIVLGSDGDRDRGKRPMMGEIAARLADVVVVTDENPRSEPPEEIRAAVMAGVMAVRPDGRDVHEVAPRSEAVRRAMELAGDGDTVIVTGKGHEPTQEVAGVFHRYNDRDAMLAAVRRVTPVGPAEAPAGPTDAPVEVTDLSAGATPQDVRAALRDLVTAAQGRRTVAVVGELDGLPQDRATAIDELDRLGRLAVRLNVGRLLAVGDAVRPVHTGALQEGSWGEESALVPDVAAAVAWVVAQVGPQDVVLVAGSARAGLGDVVAVARGGERR